ncbi:MAG TPA: CvpA family protein [Kiritimatiellia bacterium]|nr:CvpA family protein [Kiritimatiellia bacterium]
MNTIDLISALYVAFGAWRGRARGLADEGFRLLRMAVAFAAGCGLYGLVSGLLKKLLSLGGDISGPMGFALTLGGAWYLLGLAKKSFAAFLTARFAPHAALGGAIAGALRTLLIVLSVVGVLNLSNQDGVSGGSVVSRIAEWVMP